MKGLRSYVSPLMATALALIGDLEVFDAHVNGASSPAPRWHLDLIWVSKLLTLNLLCLKQPTTR